MVSRIEESGDFDELESLRRRLAYWRRRHGGRGRRIPEVFWEEASRLAARLGEARIARALGLARAGLARRRSTAEPEGGSGAFIEVGATGMGARPVEAGAAGANIFVAGPAGARMQLEVGAEQAAAAGEIVAAFLEALGRR